MRDEGRRTEDEGRENEYRIPNTEYQIPNTDKMTVLGGVRLRGISFEKP